MDIDYYDDKKEKCQSVEANFGDVIRNLYHEIAYLPEIGYGCNKLEAQVDLINVTKKNIEQLKIMATRLQELIDKHDTPRWI